MEENLVGVAKGETREFGNDLNAETDPVKEESQGCKEKSVPGWLTGSQGIITERFLFFMGIAITYGIFYTFCMYKNPYGITYPLMVAAGYGGLCWMLKELSVPIKRESWFLVAVAVLLGIATVRTADLWLIRMNKTGEVLLVIIFMIHQFYDDRNWSIGKYMMAIGIYLCDLVASVIYPFIQGKYFFKKVSIRKYQTATSILAGILAAVPILLIAGLLLGQADAVFGAIVENWIETFFNVWNIILFITMTAFGAFGIYGLVSGACQKNISEQELVTRNHEPVIAITCMSAVSLLYLFFSGIQVVYLFMGKGSLPEGMTYSSYARQGFFQLLFVAVMNLCMVLMNLKFFKRSSFLNGILTVICACTYVMIASAAYRMVIYVREYHLTYLRVLVLWFLILLAFLMGGVVILIYKNRFPLFGWCLVMVSVFYVGFSFMRPERMIAAYNGAHVEEWSQSDFEYLTQRLSADAVPAVLEAIGDDTILPKFYSGDRELFLEDYYKWTVKYNYDRFHTGIRTLNLSYEEAKRALNKRNSSDKR